MTPNFGFEAALGALNWGLTKAPKFRYNWQPEEQALNFQIAAFLSS
jgi:hypothetical protein